MENIKKPITLQIEELKKSFIDIMNHSDLPLFLLDYVVKDLYNEIHATNQRHSEHEKATYQEFLKEETANNNSAE